MDYVVLKPFPFSRDGMTEETAEAGDLIDVPADLVPGLTEAGFIQPQEVDAKDAGRSPENKMQTEVENKAPAQHSRKGRGRRG